jgi:hypothetical protein
MVDKLLK